jgi:hypothetical protein
MHITLRPEEIGHLKKAIASLEKEIRFESKAFWIQLLMGLLLVVSAHYSMLLSQEYEEDFNNLVQESFQDDKEVLMVDHILQIKVEMLRGEFRTSANALLFAVFAGIVIAGAFVQRFRWSRNHTLVLLLEKLLDSHVEPPYKPFNQDTGDAGAS